MTLSSSLNFLDKIATLKRIWSLNVIKVLASGVAITFLGTLKVTVFGGHRPSTQYLGVNETSWP